MPTDPLESLRQPVTRIEPRPEFATRLRARLVAELAPEPTDRLIDLPDRRPLMTDTTATARAQVVTPYLCVHNAAAALTFYEQAFGAFEQMRVKSDDGRIGHCEFTVGGARFMMADEYPETDVLSPQTLGGSGVSLYLEVVDVDYTYGRAVAAGAEGLRLPADQNHGNRNATIRDPFGHRWMLSQPIEALTTVEYARRETEFSVTARRAPVEPGYLTLHTPDAGVASRFFGELFGWTVEVGAQGDGYGHINNTTFPMGLAPPNDDGAVSVYFRVDGIETYASRIVELGGRVLSTNEYPSGGNAECVDNQGMRFDLFRPAPGY
ncbi:MAG: VOC family protein [Acidimicrobiales bacterium]